MRHTSDVGRSHSSAGWSEKLRLADCFGCYWMQQYTLLKQNEWRIQPLAHLSYGQFGRGRVLMIIPPQEQLPRELPLLELGQVSSSKCIRVKWKCGGVLGTGSVEIVILKRYRANVGMGEDMAKTHTSHKAYIMQQKMWARMLLLTSSRGAPWIMNTELFVSFSEGTSHHPPRWGV